MITNFKSIFDLIKVFPDEQTCIDHLEQLRWNGNVISPFDETSKVYKCKGNKYKCKNTGKYFNVKANTIFEDTKIPLQKWFMALYIFSSHKKGISSHQLARDIDVTQKTAWFLLHRLRYAFDHPNFKKMLSGFVEADETYIGGKAKNKHFNKKAKATQGRSVKDKIAIFGLIERKGNIIAQKVDDVSGKTLKPIIYKHVKKDSTLSTDEWKAYRGLGNSYNHITVNHSFKEYVNFMAHTNNMECFWSHLKRGIDGTYHWVSSEHSQSYVIEYLLRFNTRKDTTSQRFDLILGNIVGRLTYEQLIQHG
ncbi:IS1595 family transposase [Candidatus Dependentiae bacterium]|nr:IS1595 family transposase [Candidatus Dependentiae bacterium]